MKNRGKDMFIDGELVRFAHPDGSVEEGYFVRQHKNRITLKMYSGKLTPIDVSQIRQNEAE